MHDKATRGRSSCPEPLEWKRRIEACVLHVRGLASRSQFASCGTGVVSRHVVIPSRVCLGADGTRGCRVQMVLVPAGVFILRRLQASPSGALSATKYSISWAGR